MRSNWIARKISKSSFVGSISSEVEKDIQIFAVVEIVDPEKIVGDAEATATGDLDLMPPMPRFSMSDFPNQIWKRRSA